MDHQYTWTKGVLDSNYQVFKAGEIRLSLNFETFQNTATARTSEGTFTFKNMGFWNGQTQIFNEQNQSIAKIEYNSMGLKAKITLQNNIVYNWTFQSGFLSKWALSNANEEHAIYNAATGNGQIQTNIESIYLIAAGIFIREYYTRIIFILLVIFLIPILCNRV
ncbi:hypothetical protein [Pedobacter sp. MW01-1-1]|uniref:hypothetical protein n=1 Tax=Pedobacter sp. MW01-1-1 TaxID=3383027 RepID=UPI003FEE0C6E